LTTEARVAQKEHQEGAQSFDTPLQHTPTKGQTKSLSGKLLVYFFELLDVRVLVHEERAQYCEFGVSVSDVPCYPTECHLQNTKEVAKDKNCEY